MQSLCYDIFAAPQRVKIKSFPSRLYVYKTSSEKMKFVFRSIFRSRCIDENGSPPRQMLRFKQSNSSLGIHNDDNRFAFIQLKTFRVPLSRGQKGNVTNLSEAARDNLTTLTSRDSLVHGTGKRERERKKKRKRKRKKRTA